MNIKHLITLNELIKERKTGSPSELATNLCISERMLYKYIENLKHEFNAPIKYDRKTRTYYYAGDGQIHLFWESNDK